MKSNGQNEELKEKIKKSKLGPILNPMDIDFERSMITEQGLKKVIETTPTYKQQPKPEEEKTEEITNNETGRYAIFIDNFFRRLFPLSFAMRIS